jgi:hypothetical protein
MPVRRFGLVSQDPSDTATRQLTTLPATMAYFDGFIDGYQSVDPQLSYVEELWRERPDGKTEFVARFWYLPKS